MPADERPGMGAAQEMMERDKWRLAIRKCWSPPCPEIALVRDGAGWWWCDKHQAAHAADNPDSPLHRVEERITHASLTAAIAAHLARRRDEPAGERVLDFVVGWASNRYHGRVGDHADELLRELRLILTDRRAASGGTASLRDELLAWVDSRVEAEVTNRPDVNRYKRTLAETWQQVRNRLELIPDEPTSGAGERWAAAERLCRVYFEIAAEAIGEDEVRRRRDIALRAPVTPPAGPPPAGTEGEVTNG